MDEESVLFQKRLEEPTNPIPTASICLQDFCLWQSRMFTIE